MEITRIGVDLAKNVFQVHGVDAAGRGCVNKKLKREQVVGFFATLAPTLVGMEACSGAHYWARKLQDLGHTVKLISPQYVKPYVKTNKNDAIDAQAICEAVGRPHMRFVAIKTAQQQSMLMLHNVRTAAVKQRTALINQVRGELAEFGVVLPQGRRKLMELLAETIEDAGNELTAAARQLLQQMHQQLRELDAQIAEHDRCITLASREDARCRRIEQIPGIGAISATAFVAKLGDAKNFRNGRQVSSWMGLVPRQNSSGGKQVLLGISKHGDVYLRTLFIHGARAVLKAVMRKVKPDARWGWLLELLKRRGMNVAAVALANKNARTAWALLAHEREFDAHYSPRQLQA
jgi:transposase